MHIRDSQWLRIGSRATSPDSFRQIAAKSRWIGSSWLHKDKGEIVARCKCTLKSAGGLFARAIRLWWATRLRLLSEISNFCFGNETGFRQIYPTWILHNSSDLVVGTLVRIRGYIRLFFHPYAKDNVNAQLRRASVKKGWYKVSVSV